MSVVLKTRPPFCRKSVSEANKPFVSEDASTRLERKYLRCNSFEHDCYSSLELVAKVLPPTEQRLRAVRATETRSSRYFQFDWNFSE